MHRLPHNLDFSAALPPLPTGFSDEIYDICLNITSADVAQQTFEKLQPLLRDFRADHKLAVACGMLAEKQRDGSDLSSLWDTLQDLCPEDEMALRMRMRWYRRNGQIAEGVAQLKTLYPKSPYSLEQTRRLATGLTELKAWTELDQLMQTALIFQSHDRSIRMAYIKALAEQARFPQAAQIARQVAMRDRMGSASQNLLADVEAKAAIMAKFDCNHAVDVIAPIIARAAPPRPMTDGTNLVFFSGQLGTGGAERQMTRLACAFQDRRNAGQAGPMPQVWVKHANVATGADFYRPMLSKADVPTRVMTEEPEIDELSGLNLPGDIASMLSLLPADVRRHTAQLTKLFVEEKTEIAYLWQDGGIVQSAIAAILAGVPRIVTSFRGLPPNLRPRLFRDELPVLYTALARLDHVTFSANSQKTATAYEDWLQLPKGSVAVIPNAIPTILPDGDATDQSFWFDVMSRSESCSKTVIGVFRFDDNKRPLAWIEAASRYLQNNDDTRFVMLGDGALKNDAQALVKSLGLEKRVFLAGIRSNVGFYMHRADLLMHLAQMEGLPNVLIEAQLAGTPVLATPAGGTSEVVENGRTGVLLSDAQNLPTEELDYELNTLLSDDVLRARMGAAAMAHSGERFSVDTILDRTIALFDIQKQEQH